MAVNIWKLFVCTTVEETNVGSILAVMNTTELVVTARIDSIFVSSTAVHTNDFHMFIAIIHHFEGLFGSNIVTSSKLISLYPLLVDNQIVFHLSFETSKEGHILSLFHGHLTTNAA